MASLGVLSQPKGHHTQPSNPQQQQPQQQFRGGPETIADWIDNDEDEDIGDFGESTRSSGVPQKRGVENERGRSVQGGSGMGGRDFGGGGSEDRLTLVLERGVHPEPPPPGDETLKTVLQEMPEMRRMEAEDSW